VYFKSLLPTATRDGVQTVRSQEQSFQDKMGIHAVFIILLSHPITHTHIHNKLLYCLMNMLSSNKPHEKLEHLKQTDAHFCAVTTLTKLWVMTG
jgi:mannitol/fructose-specific phosphotransferase system IIA component (Ntr-type)